MILSEYFDISPPLIPPTCSTINAPTKATTTDVYGSSLTSVSNTKPPSTTTSTNTVRELQKTMSNSTMIYEEKTERAASKINGPSIEVSKANEDCINPSIIEISSIPSTSGFENKTAATVKKEMISLSRSRRRFLSEDFVYKYFPGKINYKKRKSPSAPEMHVVSGEAYRSQIIAKPQKKKRSPDWNCIYCGSTFTEDKRAKKNVKGIQCDGCLKQIHTKCVPVSHLQKGGFDLEADDESDEFFCKSCLQNK